jgi:hypothetical protein
MPTARRAVTSDGPADVPDVREVLSTVSPPHADVASGRQCIPQQLLTVRTSSGNARPLLANFPEVVTRALPRLRRCSFDEMPCLATGAVAYRNRTSEQRLKVRNLSLPLLLVVQMRMTWIEMPSDSLSPRCNEDGQFHD